MSSPERVVILLVGLPGAGKSYWLAEQRIDALSSDEMRRLLRGDVADQSIHGQVFRLLRQILHVRLQLGVAETYIDATNLTRRERRQWIKLADWYGVPCEAVYFDVPLAVCLERNRQRERVVPEEALRRMAERLTPPELAEGFRRIVTVTIDGAPRSITAPAAAADSP